jgi:hypothetical protein
MLILHLQATAFAITFRAMALVVTHVLAINSPVSGAGGDVSRTLVTL